MCFCFAHMFYAENSIRNLQPPADVDSICELNCIHHHQMHQVRYKHWVV